MKTIKNIKYNWNPEEKKSECIIYDGENTFIGEAICNPIDEDMMNDLTGHQIALYRAQLKFYQHIKNNELRPAIEALNHVCSTMVNSKKLNPKSYEYKMLVRYLKQQEADLEAVKDVIEEIRAQLKQFIDNKDKFYCQIRKNRNKDKIK